MGCASSCFRLEIDNQPAPYDPNPRPPRAQPNAPDEPNNPVAPHDGDRFPEIQSEVSSDIVVSVDFGTTHSGFAYAMTSVTPAEVYDCLEWPGAKSARAIPYCKNQTSLFYLPSSNAEGSFELKEWGWSAFLAYDQALQDLSRKTIESGASGGCSEESALGSADPGPCDSLNPRKGKEGFFATKFKLYLAPQAIQASALPCLPPDLTSERLVVDYLKILTDYAVQELTKALGRKLTKGHIQWCLTIPAIWDERAKQLMRRYAEKAGMIQGPDSPAGVSASPRPLYMILEPEAASAFCQHEGRLNITLKTGDRILVADVGGGTIDIVVHEVVESRAGIGATKVKEVVESYGALGGGSYVDFKFFNIVEDKVPCYSEFCVREYPGLPLQLFHWWQKVKTTFDGSPDFKLDFNLTASGLDKAWMDYDRERRVQRKEQDYWSLSFNFHDFKRIFDGEVDKVIDLISQKIDMVDVLMVVGGFASSPYLQKRIHEHFGGQRQRIVIPEDPGRAICKGGVWLYLNRQTFIQSRISRKTYGVSTVRCAMPGDPQNLVYKDDNGINMCRDVFSAFVRAGEQVNLGQSETRFVSPSSSFDTFIYVDIYSSFAPDPLYTTDSNVELEGSFQVDISDAMAPGINPVLELNMVWGDSLITVSTISNSFDDQRRQNAGLVVRFESH
ncbi:hypothetical protein KP509_34G029100 [Ceratopteris richardii]|uniref:Uncharacterized protein n=1 Tax=Ceratopteris richardii TaxID=49495 RepID=A0A8T2QK21_CERRI|nr:hypothetical protein KP509_34G029100 [Ceratopteris richardii]